MATTPKYNTTYNTEQNTTAAGQGAATGALSGLATGAGIGAVGGPVGAAVGGAIGAAIGAASGAGIGAWQDDTTQKAAIKTEVDRQKADEAAKIDALQANKASRTMLTAPTTAGVSNMSYMPGAVMGQTAYDSWKAGA